VNARVDRFWWLLSRFFRLAARPGVPLNDRR
jgi:hypothetical protein